MIAIDQIRREPDTIRRAMKSRGEPDTVDQILELDAAWRRDRTEADEIRNRRNQVNREIGHARSSGQPPSPEVIDEMRTLGRRVDELEASAQEAEEQVRQMLLNIPNLPLKDVPVGADSDANRIYREEGTPTELGFDGLPHWDLAERLGIIDFQRGAKLSGSRFYTTIGAGARLERALIAWMLDLHTSEHGYTELALPAVVRRDVMEGSGNLPKFADNLYHDEEDDLWLIPTAEVPITNLYRDEIIPPGELPLQYVAQTPCFRRERAAAGRDTRGIKRVHQFNKVEMYQFVEPESSADALERLLGHAEEICRRLGFSWRVLELCTGDMGFARRQDLRHRGLGRRLRGMAGGQFLLQLHRLPGPSRHHSLPARAGRQTAVAAHAERLGAGPAAGDDRHYGKQPAARRLHRHTGGPASLHRFRPHRGALTHPNGSFRRWLPRNTPKQRRRPGTCCSRLTWNSPTAKTTLRHAKSCGSLPSTPSPPWPSSAAGSMVMTLNRYLLS